jgi:hypothetical protein
MQELAEDSGGESELDDEVRCPRPAPSPPRWAGLLPVLGDGPHRSAAAQSGSHSRAESIDESGAPTPMELDSRARSDSK